MNLNEKSDQQNEENQFMETVSTETEDRAERRIFDRFTAWFPAKVKDSRDEFGTNIYLRNASASGAKFISKERFYLNDSLSLEVKLPDGKNPMNLRGQIVWARRSDPTTWDIGLKFHQIGLVHLSRLYKFCEADT